MNASILAVEIRDELYAIIREPTAVFFSIAMPVGMFAVFATLFGSEGTGPVSGATLMLATFGAFGVISVSLTPGIGIAEDRERGWLRVKRVSPVPVRTTLAAKVAASLPVAFGVYAAMSLTALAMGVFDTDAGTWLQMAGLLLLGSLPFALLSMAVGLVARGRAAPAIINAVFLPMAIAGGLWMPLEVLPPFVQNLAVWLPTFHTSQLGLGLLLGESIIDNVAALLAATAATATLAAVAYRSMRD
ncbi:MAG TPA: ABC transporter permease [Euzebyales bacterium]|nr:ABC transporter permease [Euzebyales bacterium]